MMSRTIDQLLAELQSSAEPQIPETVNRLIAKIRAMTRGEQIDLMHEAVPRLQMKADPEGWNAHKTLLGVILHAVGVKTVDSKDELAIREEIRQDLMRRNGDPQAYSDMRWNAVPDSLNCDPKN
jgi:hypothetical protein